jgi:hypothetical protein
MNPNNDRPSIEGLLKAAIDAKLGAIHTCMPAIVLDYDESTQTATVQPVLRSRRLDPATGAVITTLPQAIPGVPVAFDNGEGWSFTGPIARGDWMTLVVAERSIDEWMETGNADITPADVRRFDWSDAIAFPRGRPRSQALPVEAWAAGAVVLRSEDIRLGSSLAVNRLVVEPIIPMLAAALEDIAAALTTLGIPAPALVNLSDFIIALEDSGDPEGFLTVKVRAE